MSSNSHEKLVRISGADYAAVDVGGRPPNKHPVTGEDLPAAGKGKAVRLFPSQRAYLRSRVASLPSASRSTKEDGVIRQLIDDAMRADFGADYETRVRALAAEEASRTSEWAQPLAKRSPSKLGRKP